jgi:uncharacterized membrane protein YfcA
MSPQATQTLFATIISLIFVVSVYRLGRRQKLSFRYTVGWLVLGGLGVVAGVLSPLAEPLADQLNLSPAALLGVGGLLLLLVLCVQLSISISGLQEQVRTLAEEASYLRQELDETRSDK